MEIGRVCIQSPLPTLHSLFPVLFCLPLLLLSLSACASVRPVAKIGLIAPFEGLHRQEGYDALAAMRVALAETNRSGTDLLPLALDSSRGVERAVEKALADPAVAVVIGPYWAAEGVDLGATVRTARWRNPYAPTGDADWAADALALVGPWVESQGRALVLAGGGEGMPDVGIPTVSSPELVAEGQSVLWMGDPAGGADFALKLWERLPDAPFGLYGAGMETFRRRIGRAGEAPLFLVAWIDDAYPAWAQSHSPNHPAAYAVYRLTADSLRQLAGEMAATDWQPAIFTLSDGQVQLVPQP